MYFTSRVFKIYLDFIVWGRYPAVFFYHIVIFFKQSVKRPIRSLLVCGDMNMGTCMHLWRRCGLCERSPLAHRVAGSPSLLHPLLPYVLTNMFPNSLVLRLLPVQRQPVRVYKLGLETVTLPTTIISPLVSFSIYLPTYRLLFSHADFRINVSTLFKKFIILVGIALKF